MGEPVSIGRIIGHSFSAVATNPVVMLGTAFVFGALPSVIIGYFTSQVQVQLAGQPDAVRDGAILMIGSSLINFIFAMIAQGALVRATVAHLDGRKAGFGESVAAAMRVLFWLILLAIAIALSVWVGLLFLLVPGIMLYVIWSVASPALVEERGGVIGALGRSRRLTKGARWKVFGLQLILVIAYFLVAALLGYGAIASTGQSVAAARVGGVSIVLLVTNVLITTIMSTFWSTAQTALYVELRDWKDGPTSDRLADVFA